jgi:hypothetical protein
MKRKSVWKKQRENSVTGAKGLRRNVRHMLLLKRLERHLKNVAVLEQTLLRVSKSPSGRSQTLRYELQSCWPAV